MLYSTSRKSSRPRKLRRNDWLAAHREHSLDTVYTMGLINLPAFLLGFPLETLAGLAAFRGIWAIYIHSNVLLPIGPLRWFIGAPELHHWHHDRTRDAGNYANISPLMDFRVRLRVENHFTTTDRTRYRMTKASR